MNPKIISLGTAHPRAESSTEIGVRAFVEDLFRSGHVTVRSAETASAVWLRAARACPDAQVTLGRTGIGYRLDVSYTSLP